MVVISRQNVQNGEKGKKCFGNLEFFHNSCILLDNRLIELSIIFFVIL